jgi:hypothetical protein
MMPEHKLATKLDLTEVELRSLAGWAYHYGYMREDPRKAWTTREYKEAARFACAHIIMEKIGA